MLWCGEVLCDLCFIVDCMSVMTHVTVQKVMTSMILAILTNALTVQVNTEMYNALQVAKNTPTEKRGLNTLTAEQSAERIYKLVESLNIENSGSMWDADKGIPVPW